MLSSKSNPPPRIQRWLLHLQAYNYTIQYIKGEANAADYLSRHIQNPTKPSNAVQLTENYINVIVNDAAPKSVGINEIQAETQKDTELQQVLQAIKTRKWDNNNNTLKPFAKIRHELSSKSGVIIRNHTVVIPRTLRARVINVAHSSHQGITKTKLMIREKVWWPGVNKDIETAIESCQACQTVTPSYIKCEPLRMSEIPKTPWDTLAIDLKAPFPNGENILVIIDYCTRYPVIATLKSITSHNIIKILHKTISIFGYPKCITVDNGPQFKSEDFDNT